MATEKENHFTSATALVDRALAEIGDFDTGHPDTPPMPHTQDSPGCFVTAGSVVCPNGTRD
ncbi:hypothetical protein E2C01_068729 [Portunus trituberculatus]|uniref:Uncharacterized protein n=1 Tax=Portunus trituberculatus TaxID=210409 RepID=A0A5B7HSS2_PORTR|nr:hypothetical protein [Portunus trituberculatus]